jgi:hypothetical protein
VLTENDQVRMVSELTRLGWRLTGQQMRELQGAYVYVLWRGPRILYVGVKTSGSERPFDPEHHRVGLETDVQADDELMIYPMPTAAVARWAEKVLIARYAGERNHQRNYVGTWSQFPAEEPEVSERAGLALAL